MSPPRRPKGEKPTVTIQWQRRQLAHLSNVITALREECAEKGKLIAAQDVELSEAAERERIFIEQVERGADQYGALLTTYRKSATRLAFLEGYYDKSKELAVSEALLAHDPAKTHRGSGAGNPQDFPNGAQDTEEEGLEVAAGRARRGPREEVRRRHPDDPAYSDR